MSRRQIPRTSRTIRLGGVELIEPIAHSSTAVVWRARHVAEALPVAVKLTSDSAPRSEQAQRAFRQDVRAVARLDHPGVIKVLEIGAVSREAAALSEGRLAVGAQYLVMEHCPLGSLQPSHVRSWTEVRAALLAILQPLAHAHARGVLHHNLKPSNILISASADTQTRLQRLLLSDFGTPHALGQRSPDPADRAALYRAPELARGQHRELGPWSDLYSVGCLAWQLVSGQPPSDVSLEPAHPIPEALEPWIRRLLQPDHRLRYQRAADAAWALMAMAEPDSLQRFAPGPVAAARFNQWGRILGRPATAEPAVPFQGGTLHEWDFEDTDSDIVPTSVLPEQPDEPSPVPPFPPSWQRTQQAPTPMRLVRAGLGLFGMRPPPMTGRCSERDLLWHNLRQTRLDHQPRAVLLWGPAGLGKSRLAQWITERADELGAATVLRARHDQGSGPQAGLIPMLHRLLHSGDLYDEALKQHLLRALPSIGLDRDDHVLDVLAFLSPQGSLARRFDSPAERYAVLVRLLRGLSRERPVILWLDDLQWGADALAFLGQLLTAHHVPVLVIGTVQSEALEANSLEDQWLQWLREQQRAQELEISQLTRREQTQLVRSLLSLSDELVEHIVDRTDGNPLFAVQIIDDWVQRRLLQSSPDGLMLVDDAHVDIPDDAHHLWMQRVHSALGADMATMLPALEIASCLGRRIYDTSGRPLASMRAARVSKSGWSRLPTASSSPSSPTASSLRTICFERR